MPAGVRERCRIATGRYCQKTYSQEGEDRILLELLKECRSGFYVDVGAHHPLKYSNTQLFYERGWRGINIDPRPGSMALFRKLRPRDVNLELAVGDSAVPLTYFMFDISAVNGFDETVAGTRHRIGAKLLEKRLIGMVRLDRILSEHAPGSGIDFLNLDVEGFELNVLRTNDWVRFAPKVMAVEILGESYESVIKSEVHRFLAEQNYLLIAKTTRTSIYKRAGQAGA